MAFAFSPTFGRSIFAFLAVVTPCLSEGPRAATLQGTVSETTGTTTSALSRATVCLADDTSSCWLTRANGAFRLTFTPPPPTGVARGIPQRARFANGVLSIPVGVSGIYRLEVAALSGRLVEQRRMILLEGRQEVRLSSVALAYPGIALLRISGPGGAWNARLMHGKGSVSTETMQAGINATAARIASSSALLISAPGFVTQTVSIPADTSLWQNLAVSLVRDPIQVRFNPDPGPFLAPFSLVMSTGITNGIIRYTTDGSTPSVLSTGYASGLSISTDTFFRAQVFRSGVAQGSVQDAYWRKSMGIAPASGKYLGTVHATVTNLKGDERYTLDGSVPTASSPLLDGKLGLDIDRDAFFVVRSFSAHSLPEAMEYTVQDTSLTPHGTGKFFYDTTVVTLAAMWPDAEIHYTTDGTIPNKSSSLYSKPFGVWKTCKVLAIAYRQDYVSSIDTTSFTLVSPIPAPVFDTTRGPGFTDSILVTIYGVANLPIHYTTDGSTPTAASPIYTKHFSLKTTATVKALSGSRNLSAITTRTYNFDGSPRVSPDSGLLANQTTASVIMQSTSPVIRYTLDGTDPTELSTGYTGTLTLNAFPVTLKARAFWAGAAPSGITTVIYTQTADGIAAKGAVKFYPRISILDDRDGKAYATSTVGEQIWLAQNLSYSNAGACLNDLSGNCASRLYDWSEVTTGSSPSKVSKGICPTGTHVPNQSEWTQLVDFAGGSGNAGNALKSAAGWDDYTNGCYPSGTNGADLYGFSIYPTPSHGAPGCGSFKMVDGGSFWTSQESNADNAVSFAVSKVGFSITQAIASKSNKYWLRCIKD